MGDPDAICAMLVNAASRAIPAEATTGAEVDARMAASAACAAETAANELHQLDIRLRRAISDHMASAEVARLPSADRGRLAKSLSARKQEALKVCRAHHQKSHVDAARAVSIHLTVLGRNAIRLD